MDVAMDVFGPFETTHALGGLNNDVNQACLSPTAEDWKNSPVLIQSLYDLLFKGTRDVHAFHLWLYMLDENLTPNARDLTIDYGTIECINNDFGLTRVSIRSNEDSALNRKTQIHVLAFTSYSNDYSSKVPWDIFLKELEHLHITMHRNGEIDGDYDCFLAYKQLARLYTLHGQEQPNTRQCWVPFSDDAMRRYSIQPLLKDPHDEGPVFEFKTHYTLITRLLRAFAGNVNIPYVCVSPRS
ncbi:hypothetical protein BGW36DRAFT_422474 [Talaromyces proteolyticus]|uniref:Uncharacterized protein n=1 Tax=Talaromyces proteolyticus TaxID=1131652 RepID=A0AAD4L1Q7_9EURO|nr:uncharacterized protein BGW36DRAFT_422474 [Talaromyces proteolyticus]KAH8705947.1 hypothetical protein BGW36DRAFT_422474 [Talaromyces proteolyticus]